MAAGFKQATVNAARVPSTQTNFPAYIDLSRLGITTLAEAQSVRVYADAAKTIEWSREAVTVNQLWTKIPSLTSTTTVYIDFDGLRSDYAVGATFGRNSVWSDYIGVFHMEESSGSIVNSVGTTNVTVGDTPVFQATGKIGFGIDYDGANDEHRQATVTGATTTAPVTLQAWARSDVISTTQSIACMGVTSGEYVIMFVSSQAWALTQDSTTNSQAQSGTLSSSVNYLVHGVYASNTDRKVYVNGSLSGSNTTSRTPAAGSGLVVASRFSAGSQRMDGTIDEVRFRASALSDNWITTEYNNQNNESDFWGTWTDVTVATPSRLSLMGVGR